MIPHIIWMPNSIIVLLFIQKISKILAYILEDFLLRFCLFLGTVSRFKHFFFLQILLKKYITSIEQYVLRTLAFLSFRFFFPKSLVRILAISSLDSRERNFLSPLVNKRLGGRTLKRGWSMVYSPSASFPGKCIHRSTSFPFQYTIDCSHLPKVGQRRLVVKNQLRALSQLQTAVMTADTFLHNFSDPLLVVTNTTLKYSGWEDKGRKGIYLRPHGCSPGKFTLIIDPPGRESAERS